MAVAIVLAAGASSRLGREKALIPLGDSTLIGVIVDSLLKVCKEVVVVTRQELQVDIMLATAGARVVVNPTPETGRTGSIQVGILALEKPPRVLIAPVDRPGFNLSTLQALVREKRSVRPICNGKGGHPVNIQPRDIDKILSASPSDSLREIIRFQDVKVEGADFSLNIDIPEDIEKLQQWYESQNT